MVSGGAACAVPGSSSSSNPVGALANTLLGSSSKTQERLREIPTSATIASDGNAFVGTGEPLSVLSGSEFDHPLQPNAQGSKFLQSFHSADQNGLADIWDEIQRPQVPYTQRRNDAANFPMDHTQLQQDMNAF